MAEPLARDLLSTSSLITGAARFGVEKKAYRLIQEFRSLMISDSHPLIQDTANAVPYKNSGKMYGREVGVMKGILDV